MPKTKMLTAFAALAAAASLSGCVGGTGKHIVDDKTEVNTVTETVNETTGVYAGYLNYRSVDFQTGQLCQVFSEAGVACTDFADLNPQQTAYVAQARVKLQQAQNAVG